MAVIELYDQLRSEGTEFPPVDLDAMAPVETPERVSSEVPLMERLVNEVFFSPLGCTTAATQTAGKSAILSSCLSIVTNGY